MTGRVRVALRATAEQTLMLRVGDTGCGFPDDLDFRATDSLGLQLVCAMAEQLQGHHRPGACGGHPLYDYGPAGTLTGHVQPPVPAIGLTPGDLGNGESTSRPMGAKDGWPGLSRKPYLLYDRGRSRVS